MSANEKEKITNKTNIKFIGDTDLLRTNIRCRKIKLKKWKMDHRNFL